MRERCPDWSIIGLDNLIRPGSQTNIPRLEKAGIHVLHGDVRNASDLEPVPPCDWVLDAAANPSVLAGVDGRSSSRQVVEHNLIGTLNLLELCKLWRSGFLLLSTSRVYSITGLADLPMEVRGRAFTLRSDVQLPMGVSANGVSESFSTATPISLYGASKLASEALAMEYGNVFGFQVWINRCGVLAGAGQFGRPDQGIFSYWINSHLRGAPLCYLGFGGQGFQVRDCLHPRDLMDLIEKQIAQSPDSKKPRLVNVGGGLPSAWSLRQLTDWCNGRFGKRRIEADPAVRRFDLPWVVLDSGLARDAWDWSPATAPESIFEEISTHALKHPDWLKLSAG